MTKPATTSFSHVFGLINLAVAQPIYGLIARFPDFLAARQTAPVEIWALVATLSLLLPLACYLGLHALRRLNARLADVVFFLIIAVALTLLALAGLRPHTSVPPWLAVLLAATLGLAGCTLYFRSRFVASTAAILNLLALAVPLNFLLLSPARDFARTDEAPAVEGVVIDDPRPVVMVVFDELSLSALMNAEAEIDRDLFPNLADLADEAHWFRNATTVATSTVLAVPAMLSGKYPTAFKPPSFREYPENLFTLLSPVYEVEAWEAATNLCRNDVCWQRVTAADLRQRIAVLFEDIGYIYLHQVLPEAYAGWLPPITQGWQNFAGEARTTAGGTQKHRVHHQYTGRRETFLAFVDSIRQTDAPKLYFLHVNLPHIPYQYLPSGKSYPGGWEIPGLNLQTDFWGQDELQLVESYRRYLLQVAHVDELVGALVDKLETIGSYEDTLLIVAADHGVSFKPGSRRRDPPPLSNLDQDILPIPLFIKLPGQRQGIVSDANVESVDILPTIIDTLEITTSWKLDGRSVIDDDFEERPLKTAYYHYRQFKRYEAPAGRVGWRDSLAWKLALFEANRGVAGLFRSGPYQALYDRPTASLPIGARAQGRYQLVDAQLYQKVDPSSSLLPALARASITLPGHAGQRQSVAVALNGRIKALTAVQLDDAGIGKLSTMVPEDAFIPGTNTIELFVMTGRPGAAALQPLSPEDASRGTVYSLAADHLLIAEAATNDQVRLDFTPHRFAGSLEQLHRSSTHIEVFGWAMDIANKDEVEAVLVFDGEQNVYRTETIIMRGEAERLGARSAKSVGFHFQLPLSLFDGAASEVRIIALSRDGYAAELLQGDAD